MADKCKHLVWHKHLTLSLCSVIGYSANILGVFTWTSPKTQHMSLLHQSLGNNWPGLWSTDLRIEPGCGCPGSVRAITYVIPFTQDIRCDLKWQTSANTLCDKRLSTLSMWSVIGYSANILGVFTWTCPNTPHVSIVYNTPRSTGTAYESTRLACWNPCQHTCLQHAQHVIVEPLYTGHSE